MIYSHPIGTHMELPSVKTKEDLERFEAGLKEWEDGALIQLDRALGWLTIDEREFIISGYTAAQWDALFAEDK